MTKEQEKERRKRLKYEQKKKEKINCEFECSLIVLYSCRTEWMGKLDNYIKGNMSSSNGEAFLLSDCYLNTCLFVFLQF